MKFTYVLFAKMKDNLSRLALLFVDDSDCHGCEYGFWFTPKLWKGMSSFLNGNSNDVVESDVESLARSAHRVIFA